MPYQAGISGRQPRTDACRYRKSPRRPRCRRCRRTRGRRGARRTLAGRRLYGVRRQQARHAKQRLAETILDDALVVRKDQRFAAPTSRWRLNNRQLPSLVAIFLSRSAIGSGLPSTDGHRSRAGPWAERRTDARGPLLQNRDRGIETGAHHRLPLAARLEPDRKPYRLLHHLAVLHRHLLGAGLDPERRFGETRDRMQGFVIQRA